MVVYSLPISTLTMTLYLSYPMTTMEMMEPVPKMPPRQPYSRHAAALSGHVSRVTCHNVVTSLPKGPHIQYRCVKALMMTGTPMVVIMHRSENARFTTNMLEGVRKPFT